MSARNAFAIKRSRRLVRQEQRKANEDAAVYSGPIRVVRPHTSRAGVEYPPQLIGGRTGNTSPAGRRRLSEMQQGANLGVKCKTVPLRLELKERITWGWKLLRQPPRPRRAA